MKTRYVFPLIAIFGFLLAVRVIIASNQKTPDATVLVEPVRAPFASHVAGAGVIESLGEDISLAPDRSGVIKEVFVKPGDNVKRGEPLLALDSARSQADLNIRKAAVQVAEAQVGDAKNELALWQGVTDRRAVSVYEVKKREFGLQIAQANLQKARTEFDAANTELEKLTVVSPIDGQVLQVRARIGEYAETRNANPALIVLGDTTYLQVRADIDENDAWRVNGKANAKIYMRGNPVMNADVEFVRFDPLVIPKHSLTGDSTERVDTRVLQVIFKLKREALNIYVGQLVDVYIEAKPLNAKSAEGDTH